MLELTFWRRALVNKEAAEDRTNVQAIWWLLSREIRYQKTLKFKSVTLVQSVWFPRQDCQHGRNVNAK